MITEFIKRYPSWVIFGRRFMKHGLILVILVLMIIPLYFKSYTLAKQLTLDKSESKLLDGVELLEQQVLRAQTITNLLRQEESFKRLFFLKGPPSSEYYLDINVVQSRLKNLALTQDMYSNVYIRFRENPVFISNYISSDNYEDVYARYYRYGNLSAEQWQKRLFGENYTLKLFPADQVYSSYYHRQPFGGITIIINNSYFNAFDPQSVLAIDMDRLDLLDKLLYADQWKDHFVYIADNEGRILMSHNYDAGARSGETQEAAGPISEIKLAGETYIALAQTSELLGLKVVVGIPAGAFEGNVNSLLELLLLYIVAGMALVVLLAFLFSMREALSLKKLVETAARSTKTGFNLRNEYKYLDNAFAEIHTINEQQHGRIEALNDSIKYSIAKHLLILGVFTEREKEEAAGYFGSAFERFCVAKAVYRVEEGSHSAPKTAQQNMGLALEERFNAVLRQRPLALNFHANETVFVLFLGLEEGGAERLDLKARLAELIRSLNAESPLSMTVSIGISEVMSGPERAKAAYQQAKYALGINENEVASGVYLFEAVPDPDTHPAFDNAVLLKLYDALIAGEKSPVSQILEDCLGRLADYSLPEQEQLQIFFSVRQTVSSAHKVIVGGKDGPDGQPVDIPAYDQSQDIMRLADRLRLTALDLCAIVIGNKKSNNDKLKTDILNHIRENCGDPGLSAGGIASELLISEKYVFSFVKEQTGKSLGKYIEEIRLANAERLLLETDYSNNRIWKQCGFGSENTFYRAFSKKHGVTPTVWRENQRNLTGWQ
ncbi:helix-turn-helix domain-containing protein [Paenibacillus sp. S150]|uniref:helix-turn-helix domain-containing protein n=1 Tax=Paenibacillus sp. S150 TaxID=2749826 RepID=UPI001C56F634|nr:helix-turn-helix domain-containing protein [Paenibacillus sp. S150]MBW4084956.1 AraC family transcriptional regulator [Paenibacillus sp. S150]